MSVATEKSGNPLLGASLEGLARMNELGGAMARLGLSSVEAWARAAELVPGMGDFAGAIGRHAYASAQTIDLVTRRHPHPEFAINSVQIDGLPVTVHDEIVQGTDLAFGVLRHFQRDFAKGHERHDPKVLVVAPTSGHRANLVAPTIESMLPTHDMYVTDMRDAREVSTSDGTFGLDTYTNYVEQYLETLGRDTHVVAICQATVPTLAAIAHMAQTHSPNQPRSLTLIAGPLDTRVNPTAVDTYALQQPVDDLLRRVLTRVPAGYPGAGRKVYPGGVQLGGFMSMNPSTHQKKFQQYYDAVAGEDDAAADKIRAFYENYLDVVDLDAVFYEQTIRDVFADQKLAKGTMEYAGMRVDPGAIEQTAVLAVEGELDDICGLGQTKAALSWLHGLAPEMRQYHMLPGVGHYGSFAGRVFKNEALPHIAAMIREHSPIEYSPVSYN